MTEHHPLPPFAATAGPKQARMLLVGEAWGASEEETRRPFVGYSGKELWLMLGEAMPEVAPEAHARATKLHKYGNAWIREREHWLADASIAMTNVLALRPPANQLVQLAVSKTDLPEKGKNYTWPAVQKGKYLRPEYLPELDRLQAEIEELQPNLIVALGATAAWALLQSTAIGSIRGAITEGSTSSLWPRRKVLPTWHPQYINYDWSQRPIAVVDLMKAGREAQFPEIRRPKRSLLVDPTLQEIIQWTKETLCMKPPVLACDVETANGQITCIGFARSRSQGLVIPFMRKDKTSYWPQLWEEQDALEQCKLLLESDIPKVGQNFLYDLQYIYKYGIRPRALRHDTMLLHHSLFPEVRKGLGFLGSIYTSEPAWKLMRTKKADTVKREE